MNKQSNASMGQDPDSEGLGAGSDRGIDAEIAGLRDESDQHLRNLETVGTAAKDQRPNPTPPIQGQYGLGNNRPASDTGSSNRSAVIVAAAAAGALSSLVVATYLRSSGPAASPPQISSPPQAPLSAPDKSASSDPPVNPGLEKGFTTAPAQAGRWQACAEQFAQAAEPPRPGETWWPIVGPRDSLDDARRYCRADAFVNRSDNAQIASFRDYDTAVRFADQLTRDTSHRWSFRVGEPSVPFQ